MNKIKAVFKWCLVWKIRIQTIHIVIIEFTEELLDTKYDMNNNSFFEIES